MVAFARNRMSPLDDSGLREWLDACGSDAELRAMRRQLTDLVCEIDRRMPLPERAEPEPLGLGWLLTLVAGGLLWISALDRFAEWLAR